MSISTTVEESLKEAEASLRNALAYAARQEKPFIAKAISQMMMDIDNILYADKLFDNIEDLINKKNV